MRNDRLTLMAAACAVTMLASACLKPPRPAATRAAEVATVAAFLATPTGRPTTVAATATPTPALMETEAGEALETPTPPAEGLPAATPAALAEPPSLLAKLDGATPPSVAAALRLIEDGRALLAQEIYDRALDRFERALAIDPANAYGYYFLARLHYQRHEYDQAIAFADKAAVLSARTDRPWMSRAYTFQGTVFEEVGRYGDARAAYRKALAADPANLPAQVGIGRLGGDGTAP